MIFRTDIWPRLAVIATIFLWAFSGRSSQLEPYTETISGTVVTFEMVPVRGGLLAAADAANPNASGVLVVGDFWIGKTEVTWDEYDVWQLGLDHEPAERRRIDAESRPSRPYGAPDWGFGHSGFATVSVTIHAADEYARWLAEKTGKNYRLPTAEEWRYACSMGAVAGVQTSAAGPPRTGAIDAEYLDAVAWYAVNADRATHAVASKQPDALGIYDLLGNAGEWARDAASVAALYGGSYRDEAAAIHCGAGAVRTRAWNSTDPQLPKSTWWLSDGPFAGFRIARDPEGDESVR
jgi:formylglycine-generating enzyme required for sulfatase activity